MNDVIRGHFDPRSWRLLWPLPKRNRDFVCGMKELAGYRAERCGGMGCAVSDMTRMYRIKVGLLPNETKTTQERGGCN